MHSSPLLPLQRAVTRHLSLSSDHCRLLHTPEAASHAQQARPATRGIDEFDIDIYPPFETVTLGQPVADARAHGVVILNDGPRRHLDIAVRGAGLGQLFDGTRLLDSGKAVRISLQRPDRYELVVGAPGSRGYEVEIEPAWFERGAGVTDVVVRPDGYVRYQSL